MLSDPEEMKKRITRPPGEAPVTMPGGTSDAPSAIGAAIDEAIEKHPEILNGLKKYFAERVIVVGICMAMFDLATISIGLTLVENFKGWEVWLPIAGVLYTSMAVVLKRVLG